MATAPLKSQPKLHNFSLPHLRWAHKTPHLHQHQQQQQHRQQHPHSTIHRFRRRDSPDSDSENPPKSSSFPSRAPRKVKPPFSSSTSFVSCSSEKDQKPEKHDVVEEEVIETENDPKPWNLRPRRVVSKEKLQDETGSYWRNNNESGGGVLKSYSRAARGTAAAEGGGGVVGQVGYGTERQQRKVVEEKKKRLWISLSKEEIEEDVYSLTGSRPSRRPKKRPRNIQKQLDNVFPGLYLVGMTADSFRGHDHSLR
ncbi:hypothetical protein ACH5RR_040273 [Cinchona calisaya]|uniref:Uncharacterized protein n=1 Tax=Cinchona calisaya TaxID=153742 RepID=A0ABD2XRM5_9GENT